MIRISGGQINIARELLDMLYKPSEFAEELGTTKQTVYSWIKSGMPAQKDKSRRAWIHGTQAGLWLVANGVKQPRKSSKSKHGANMIYCLKCRDFRAFTDARYEALSGERVRLIAKCAKCGTTVYQFQKVKK